MRAYLLLLLVLCSTLTFAQRPGGPGGRGQGQNAAMPEIKTEALIGIQEYNIKTVYKRLKMKSKDSLAQSIENAIVDYNSQMAQIKAKNKDLFDGLDVVVNANIKTAMQNRDRESMMKTMTMVKEKTEPVVAEAKKLEDDLNASFKLILDETQYKSWMKYQKSTKEKLMPRPANRGGDRSRSRSGGGRGS